jgi:DNA repair protein RecN (Recombination protein N)
MLTVLSIRDVVLIDRLDLSFGRGLTVLTGETGAGKSILLDSLGLALGARAEAGLVRAGCEQAVVTASFDPPAGHPALALLAEQGLEAEDGIVLRRVLGADGRSRAFVNDQPVGVALLRRAGGMLVEVQGQHDQMGLADTASHVTLLDAYGVAPSLRAAVASGWAAWRDALTARDAAAQAIASAKADEEWLRHAVDELAKLAPSADEEDRLAAERHRLQRDERRVEAIAAALSELAPNGHGRSRSAGPAASLRAAGRALGRLAGPGDTAGDVGAAEAQAALERAEEAVAEAETLLSRLAAEADPDPRALEAAEERLFALRASARKHAVAVPELPGLLDTLATRLAALETGAQDLVALEAAVTVARVAYGQAAERLSAARAEAAVKLERAAAKELPPLRLDRARFVVSRTTRTEADWGPLGIDAVRFLIATNPGQEPGPLARVASGGELSRLMLALKVVLSGGGEIPTLVFDEVDSGVGGATAAAVGERLARVAERVQVLVVTHSPQVAARGAAHLRVTKSAGRTRTLTQVAALDAGERREEIARMLAGERITDAARAAADDLLGVA